MDNQNTNSGNPEKKFSGKLVNLIKRNPVTVILLTALIIVFIWLSVKNSSIRRQYEKEISEMTRQYEKEISVTTNKYEVKIDSLLIRNLDFASKVFSWSIRSEMLRKNVENLNQLFTVFVRESDAVLAQLVNLEDNKIIISTDKQFEGNEFKMPDNLSLTSQGNIKTGSKSTIFTPVMGFNNPIALMIVEYENK